MWRAAVAELLGTALLLLLGCQAALAHPAGFGLVVAALVQALDRASGAYFNPAVTLAAALSGREPVGRAFALCVSQVAGGVLGFGGLRALLGAECPACLTLPAAGLPAWRALLLEAALAGTLALVNLAAWDRRDAHLRDSWPLRIGTAVGALSLAGGSLTGAGMNPARSLPPALLLSRWEHHWLYWVGPLSGSAAATLLYRRLWAPPPSPSPHANIII